MMLSNMLSIWMFRLFVCVLLCTKFSGAFVSHRISSTPKFTNEKIIIQRLYSTPPSSSSSSSAMAEAQALLERARKVREEIASLEGVTVEQVEEEAANKRQREQAIIMKAAVEREELRNKKLENKFENTNHKMNGKYLLVPETPEDQVVQAKQAIERAFQDGINRQVVRFVLLPEGENLNNPDTQQWPGGAQQMYRRAAGPMTRDLLRQVRAKTKSMDSSTEAVNESIKSPIVKSQDVWDFDGSAIITAEASTGPGDDIQALVLPNTDNKYTEDIATISTAMKQRLFLLINPFWRNVDSWGFNILAPNAKKRAQEVIFDGGFQETYCLIQKSVRGEDCIALKAYPYDWQLYAYSETEYWPYEPTILHLGSTDIEPTASNFTKYLEQRDEFKMSKNMRQMQRMINQNK